MRVSFIAKHCLTAGVLRARPRLRLSATNVCTEHLRQEVQNAVSGWVSYLGWSHAHTRVLWGLTKTRYKSLTPPSSINQADPTPWAPGYKQHYVSLSPSLDWDSGLACAVAKLLGPSPGLEDWTLTARLFCLSSFQCGVWPS